jgi:hypothetical protein
LAVKRKPLITGVIAVGVVGVVAVKRRRRRRGYASPGSYVSAYPRE